MNNTNSFENSESPRLPRETPIPSPASENSVNEQYEAGAIAPETLSDIRMALLSATERDRQRAGSVAMAQDIRQAIDALERLPVALWQDRSRVTSYLMAILIDGPVEYGIDPMFALAIERARRSAASVSASLSVARETNARDTLSTLDGDAVRDSVVGEIRASRLAVLMSAHLFIVARPDDAFSGSFESRQSTVQHSSVADHNVEEFEDVAHAQVHFPFGRWVWRFNVSAWRLFVNDALSATFLVAMGDRMNAVYVEDLPPRTDDAFFRASLDAWVAQASSEESESRVEAALLMSMCREDGATALDLSYFGLTSLPRALWFVDQVGTVCCERGGLRDLRLNGNRLTTLPDELCLLARLEALSVADNQLTTLPETLGVLSALRVLRIADNELSTLPESIGQLTRLEKLIGDACLLTVLPRSIGGLVALESLDLEDNVLTSLPTEFARLPTTCVVRLFSNPLSRDVRKALLTMASGPLVRVEDEALEQIVSLSDTRPLSQVLAAWYEDADLSGVQTSAGDEAPARFDMWHRWSSGFEAEDRLANLLNGLQNVPDALNWNTRQAFRQRVVDAISMVERQSALISRSLTLAAQLLTDVVSPSAAICMAFLERVEAFVDDNTALRERWPTVEIFEAGRQRFRRVALEFCVAQTSALHPFVDVAEIRLAYRCGLVNRFVLPDDGYGNEAFVCPVVSDEAIDQAENHVNAALATPIFVDFMIDYAAWRADLFRHHAPTLEAMLSNFDLENDAKLDEAPEQLRARRRAQTQHFDDVLRSLTRRWMQDAT